MTLEARKMALVKKILDTNDKDIIIYLQTVFDTEKEWLARYPKEVQENIIESKKQIALGKVVPDKEVRKMARQWLKK